MLKMTLEIKLHGLYTFYGLPAPEGETVDAFFDILGEYDEANLDAAIAAFRSDHEKIRRGENVAYSLRKYAETARLKVRRSPRAGDCPEGCSSGAFFVASTSATGSPYYVVPCAFCSPSLPGALTRKALENSGRHILAREALATSAFFPE